MSAETDLLQIIAERRTTKVLAPPDAPLPLAPSSAAPLLTRMLTAGGHAPYHHVCHEVHREDPGSSPAPFRFHVVDAASCRALAARIGNLDGPVAKTVGLLGAADGCILANWLPDPADEPAGDTEVGGPVVGLDRPPFAPTRRNIEHVAATAAAIQNMLLVATEAGVRSFWSSGGPYLGRGDVRGWLGIPEREVLLGAIYLFPAETGPAEVKPGAHRGKAGAFEAWSRWVSL